MALLKKIKSATLIEALVATALVVVIFIIASLILNNLLLNSFKKKENTVEYRLNQLEYQLYNRALRLPHKEEYENWQIETTEDKTINGTIVFIAKKKNANKIISKKIRYEQ